jgi:chorismate dehydratase
MKTIKVGTLTFLNVKPVFYGLEMKNGSNRVELLYSEPWKATDLLLSKEIDLGILPSIEYSKTEELAIVRGISISSKGSVGSVKLFSNKPLKDITTIAVDSRSRTSVALLKILCKEFYGIKPRFTEMRPSLHEMLESNDACLLIGDDALYIEDTVEEVRDLSQDWFSHTGYPFVFAFMAGWPGVVEQAHIEMLHESLELGLNNIHKIAENHPSPRIASAAELNEKYLTENINYAFGENELNGLKLFYIKAWENGLIDGVPRITFFEEDN